MVEVNHSTKITAAGLDVAAVDGMAYSPAEAEGFIIQQLLEDVERASGAGVAALVVGKPADYGEVV